MPASCQFLHYELGLALHLTGVTLSRLVGLALDTSDPKYQLIKLHGSIDWGFEIDAPMYLRS